MIHTDCSSKESCPSGSILCSNTTTVDSQRINISIWTLRSKRVSYLTLMKNLHVSQLNRIGKLIWKESSRRKIRVKIFKMVTLRKSKNKRRKRNSQTKNLRRKMRSTWTRKKRIGFGQDANKKLLQKLEGLKSRTKEALIMKDLLNFSSICACPGASSSTLRLSSFSLTVCSWTSLRGSISMSRNSKIYLKSRYCQ